MPSSPPRYSVGFAWLATLRPTGALRYVDPPQVFSRALAPVRLPRVPSGYAWRQPRRAQEQASEVRRPPALDDGSEQANPSARALGRAERIGDALTAPRPIGRIVVIEGAPGIARARCWERPRSWPRETDGRSSRARRRNGARVRARRVIHAGAENRAPHERERERLRGCRGPGAPLFGSSRPRGCRRSPLRTIPRACTGCARGWPTSAARPARRRCHWADEQSLRFVAYLQARIEEIPACAILAVRTARQLRARSPAKLIGLNR